MVDPLVLEKLRDGSRDWPVVREAVIRELAHRYRQHHELLARPDATHDVCSYIAAFGGATGSADFITGSHPYARTRIDKNDHKNVAVLCAVGESGSVTIRCVRTGDTWASEFASPHVVRDTNGKPVQPQVSCGDGYQGLQDAILAGGAALRVRLCNELIDGTWPRDDLASAPTSVEEFSVALATLPPIAARCRDRITYSHDSRRTAILDVWLDEPTGPIEVTVQNLPHRVGFDELAMKPTAILVKMLYRCLEIVGSNYDANHPELGQTIGNATTPGPARRSRRDPTPAPWRRQAKAPNGGRVVNWQPKITRAKRYNLSFPNYDVIEEPMDLFEFIERIDFHRIVHADEMLDTYHRLPEVLAPLQQNPISTGAGAQPSN